MLFALTTLLIASTAYAEDAENPGPHVVARTQPACQNLADYDQLQLYIRDKKNPLERARAKPYYESLTDPDNPRNGGRLCLMLQKGTTVRVEKRFGLWECVRFKGAPVARLKWEDKCFWATQISDYAKLDTSHIQNWWW